MSGQFGPVTADPVGLGRRIAGRVINAAIGVAIYAIMFLPLGETAATGYIRQPAWAAVLIAVVLSIAVGVMDIFLILVKSTTIGPWLLGQFWIQVPTGEDGKLQYLLKLVVQSVFEGATLGIGTISLVVTYRDGQHWLDRAFGVVAVERSSVRAAQAGQGYPGPPVPAVTPVAMPAPPSPPVVPPPAFPAAPPPPSPAAPPAPTAAPAASPFAPPNPWARPDEQEPAAAPPVAPPAPAANPFAPPTAAQAAPVPPPFAAPPVVAPAASFLDDRTVVEPEEDRTLVVVLDDGQEIRVDGPVVLGRNPVPPAAYPQARPVQVQDASMRMSKTHLVLVPSGSGVGFVDVGATNGVSVELDEGLAKVAPQQVHELPAGVVVHFGGRSLRVPR
ncbi:MAG TPA: hypothetical protein PKG51_00225 [Arachnia sp.]|jgi:hypothetical protein|nr:hypothetical protein [Arachnia sp.]